MNICWSKDSLTCVSVVVAQYNTTMSTCGGVVWGPLIGDQLSAAHRVKSEVFPHTCGGQTPGDTQTLTFTPCKLLLYGSSITLWGKRELKDKSQLATFPLCLAVHWLIYLLLPIRGLAFFSPQWVKAICLCSQTACIMLGSVCVSQPTMSCCHHTQLWLWGWCLHAKREMFCFAVSFLFTSSTTTTAMHFLSLFMVFLVIVIF